MRYFHFNVIINVFLTDKQYLSLHSNSTKNRGIPCE